MRNEVEVALSQGADEVAGYTQFMLIISDGTDTEVREGVLAGF